MATILNYKKSTYGSPYAWYKLETTSITNRTASTVDITFKSTSRLDNAGSSLGRSYNLTAGIYLKNKWYTYKIKDNESWSGTTEHTKTTTITVTDLSAGDTAITGIKYRVVSSASDNASGLNATACSNITIQSAHDNPILNSFTITETNPKIGNKISNDWYIFGLSQKQVNLNVTYDTTSFKSATLKTKTQYLDTLYPATNVYDTNPYIINFSQNQIPIVGLNKGILRSCSATFSNYVVDNLNSISNTVEYNQAFTLDTYSKVTINGSAKRIGQTSGQVALECSGTFMNQLIGNFSGQTGEYKPTIKYKFWESGDTEPNWDDVSVQVVTINNSDVVIDDGTFTISNLYIGNTTPGTQQSGSYYFDYEKAYRLKIQVSDNFSEEETPEISISVGEAIWTEYLNRVDFKKLTINDEPIITIEQYEEYTGAVASGSNATITFDITKTGYTPIGIVGCQCNGTNSSFINVFAFYLYDSTEARAYIKNTLSSGSLVANNTTVKIYVAYIRS